MEDPEESKKDLLPQSNYEKRKSGHIGVPEFHRLPSFTEVDADGNGAIEFDEFKKHFPSLPDAEVHRIFLDVDLNHDGVLDREEFSTWKMKASDFARTLILPRNIREDMKKRPEKYKDLYDCMPPPIFMVIITIIELSFFGLHAYQFSKEGSPVYNYGPAPIDSVLIYNPERRYEVWRYFTYVFVHSGYMHIVNNVLVQLMLGILLEGILAGSLATSVVDPYTYLAGASAGVYALIFAHLSTVILNWPEMGHPWIRVMCFGAFVVYDVGIAFYFAYYLGRETNVGYAAHLGGGIIGLLTGIYILKNVKWERWETYLWYASVVIVTVLALFALAWNVFNKDYYPQNKY